MITGPVFDTFSDAYLAVLDHVFHHATHCAAARGKQAIETLNTSFTVRNPIARIPYLAARRTNVVFHHAETLWYLAGRDDPDMIAYYAPGLRRFSPDGERLTGTAYGPRLFAPSPPDGRSQFQRVLRLLRAEPGCKRAAMPIMRADELADPANPDVACTLGLQFLLRDRRLHAAAHLRGNDAVVGLLGDNFAFTFIQELAARLLGVEVGTYAHHVGSMHINTGDLARVRRILTDRHLPSFPHATMPASTTWDVITTVQDWEHRLRTNQTRYAPGAAALPTYWQQVLALFEIHRQIVHQPGQPLSHEALDALRPGHRWLVEQRWPTRMPRRTPGLQHYHPLSDMEVTCS
ncbi:MAG: thymidylate synthase [Natronosporangium sp.]